MIVFYTKKMKILIFFCSNDRNFSIIVFEKFAFIRKFSIHRSHFVNFFFIQNENFRFFTIFFYIQQIKTFEKSHSISIIKQIKKKIDIIFLTLTEKSNTYFEIILKVDIF